MSNLENLFTVHVEHWLDGGLSRVKFEPLNVVKENIKLKKLLDRCAAAMIENDGDAMQELISQIGGLSHDKKIHCAGYFRI